MNNSLFSNSFSILNLAINCMLSLENSNDVNSIVMELKIIIFYFKLKTMITNYY